MLAIFFICFCLGTNVHAGVIATTSTITDTTTTSPPFYEDAELKKITETCFFDSDFEELTGYTVRRSIAYWLAVTLIPESVATIGLTELRSTLNLEPLPPWKPFSDTEPSDWDFASAPSIQAYYDLKEPRSKDRSLDSTSLYEHNVTTAVAYLDKRFPAIRKIFRRRFQEVHTYKKLINRKGIDRMIEEYQEVFKRVTKALEKMEQVSALECED
ncbi:unnamed protein product [Caenorhabditis nigoni]